MTDIKNSSNALWIILTLVLGGGGSVFGFVQTTSAADAHRTSVANIDLLRAELHERDEKMKARLEKATDKLSDKLNELVTVVAKLKGTVEALED